MSDERLTVEYIGDLYGRQGILLRGSEAAVKRASALFREQVAIVPLEGDGFEAARERAAEAIYDAHWGAVASRAPWPQYVNADVFRRDARVALRAALTPGDNTNG